MKSEPIVNSSKTYNLTNLSTSLHLSNLALQKVSPRRSKINFDDKRKRNKIETKWVTSMHLWNQRPKRMTKIKARPKARFKAFAKKIVWYNRMCSLFCWSESWSESNTRNSGFLRSTLVATAFQQLPTGLLLGFQFPLQCCLLWICVQVLLALIRFMRLLASGP